MDLVPSIDFEVANINISIKDENEVEEKVITLSDDRMSAVAWHYDSFPFVCVTMLSDCTGMVGGETALRMPSGEVRKVRGPAMVSYSSSRISLARFWKLTGICVGNGSRDARPVHRAPSPKSHGRP